MDKFKEIENHLRNAFIIKDQPIPEMNLAEQMARLGVPGVSVAVINNGEIEWAKGYGLVEAGETQAVNEHTRFQAASISKPVAAFAAMRLVEEGLLNLDEDVNHKLKTWKVPENEFTVQEKVTLRRLVSHNAGLTVHGFPGYARSSEIPSVPQILDGIPPANTAAVRVDVTPGSIWRYSGGGTTVMMQMMMDVTGQAFPDIMQSRVLGQVGMSDSTYQQPLPEAWHALAATAHRPGGALVEEKWHVYPEMSAAGLWTTPTDLLKYALELQNAAAGKSKRVVSQSMARQILTNQFAQSGLGPMINGEGQAKTFSHGGSNEGFRCELIAFANNGQGAAVMTNSDLGGDLCMGLLRSIAFVYGWSDSLTKEKVLQPQPEDVLKQFEGKYGFAELGVEGTVKLDGGKLMMSVAGLPFPEMELKPERENCFFIIETGMEITFKQEGDTSICELGLSGHTFKGKKA
jgi:CubicO group peptidase (beta-lactamase class C family)